MSLTCPRCQVENRDQAKRCLACNTDLTHVRPSSGPRATSTRLCPAGRHPMDPSWKACHYCKADEEAKGSSPPAPSSSGVRRSTVMENYPATPPPPPASPQVPPPPPTPPSAPPQLASPPAAPRRRKTQFLSAASEVSVATDSAPVSTPPPAPAPTASAAWPQPQSAPVPAAPAPSKRRKTMFGSAPAEIPVSAPAPVPAPPAPTPAPALTPAPVSTPAPVPTPSASAPTGRRIVALLITYSWQSDGQVFPVREGRNYLGSDPECDIAVDRDPQLSGRHATILYRGRGFWIDDEKSMNGTFVGDECVEEKQRLDNYAEIRTGSTVWRFIVVEPSND